KLSAKKRDKRSRARYHFKQDGNFSVGDYVLRSRVNEKLHANKLRIMWVGQYRVMASTDYYFTAEYLVNGGIMNVHPLRIKFYARLKIRRSYSTTSLSRDV
ncbi:hypothetical protein L917_11954, partial [Phytophthora nicotianae]